MDNISSFRKAIGCAGRTRPGQQQGTSSGKAITPSPLSVICRRDMIKDKIRCQTMDSLISSIFHIQLNGSSSGLCYWIFNRWENTYILHLFADGCFRPDANRPYHTPCSFGRQTCSWEPRVYHNRSRVGRLWKDCREDAVETFHRR